MQEKLEKQIVITSIHHQTDFESFLPVCFNGKSFLFEKAVPAPVAVPNSDYVLLS